MSRLLAELLGAREPGFSLMVKQLEQICGKPGADVRLSADIVNKSKHKICHLQLDNSDTNGPELYHSLQHLIERHDRTLASALCGNNADAEDKLLAGIRDSVNGLSLPKTCWALKPAAAKRLLKNHPPKNVMKQLGYRSMDSMLKREKCSELLSATYFLESPQWHSRFLSRYKHLRPSDFERRDIELLLISPEKWGQPARSYAEATRQSILCIREMGVVAILPLPAARLRGLAIIILPLIIQAIHRIRMFSVKAKLSQVRPDFGMLVTKSARDDSGTIAEIAGHPVSWPLLQRHFGTKSIGQNTGLFEPHVVQEDLHWESPATVLASLHSELNFWQDAEHVGATYPDGIVSYNLLDAAINYCNNVPYHKRIVYHMRESLWHELFARYLRQPLIEQNLIKQMESNLTA